MKTKRNLFVAVGMLLICMTFGTAMTVQAAETEGRVKDYFELEKQIGIANGLDYYDYTKESWEVLRSTVEAGNQRLADATEQSKLDEAAQDIRYAIDNLVKMDYSSLSEALDQVYARIEEDTEVHDVWYRLDKAVDKARPLLVSGDQEAVNEMADTLNAIMEELHVYDEENAPEVVVQEVKVEVPPASDFCNISLHRTWPVLFAISAVFNVILFAVLGYILLKKRNTTDNTPLVDYDIEDDEI